MSQPLVDRIFVHRASWTQYLVIEHVRTYGWGGVGEVYEMVTVVPVDQLAFPSSDWSRRRLDAHTFHRWYAPAG